MTTPAPRIFLIAVEESGDRIGADLMRALRRHYGDAVSFEGIGGAAMTGEGLQSLFDPHEVALIGFVAIVQKLPMLLRRIRESADAVVRAHPDMLVIIDSPDFTHRVARRVRKQAPDIKIVNYVSPTVWVWRGGRAKAMRAYIDRVLAIFPFEPAVHQRLQGPPCTYVGHPLMSELDKLRPNEQEEARRTLWPPLVMVLPGSRRSEVERLLPIFGAAIQKAHDEAGSFDLVLPTLPRLEAMVRTHVSTWPVQPRIVTDDEEKFAAFRTARAALVKSGTVTLELALARVPMVAAYKVGKIEEWIVRVLVNVTSAILPNLIVDKNFVPEFLQERCNGDALGLALAQIIEDGAARARQMKGFDRLMQVMTISKEAPGDKAARIIASEIAAKPLA